MRREKERREKRGERREERGERRGGEREKTCNMGRENREERL